MKQVKQFSVVRQASEVVLQYSEHARLQNDPIVDGNCANLHQPGPVSIQLTPLKPHDPELMSHCELNATALKTLIHAQCLCTALCALLNISVLEAYSTVRRVG